jgi:phospholipid/cholesterol/gamma-HCH transport system ATP-binding protein
MIEVKNLSYSFGNHLIFQDIHFTLVPGDRLCIIGKSGEGKSVLFKLLCGLIPPQNGSIHFFHQSPYPPTKSFTDYIGVVFQYPALIDHYNLWENIGIKDIYQNLNPNSILEKVKKILPSVGLNEKDLFKKVEELSGGMKKRASIARALYHQPKVLLFDEPHTGLDPINARLIDNLVMSIFQPQNILIVVTHDMTAVKNIANKILLIDQKRGFFFENINTFLESNHPTIQNFLISY